MPMRMSLNRSIVKRLAAAGFLFFLLKGIAWLAVGAFAYVQFT